MAGDAPDGAQIVGQCGIGGVAAALRELEVVRAAVYGVSCPIDHAVGFKPGERVCDGSAGYRGIVCKIGGYYRLGIQGKQGDEHGELQFAQALLRQHILQRGLDGERGIQVGKDELARFGIEAFALASDGD